MDDTVPVWVVMVCFGVIGALYAASHVTIHKRISENKKTIADVEKDYKAAIDKEEAINRHSLERIQDDVNGKHHRLRNEYTELHALVLQTSYTIGNLSKKENTALVEALADLRKMTELSKRSREEV